MVYLPEIRDDASLMFLEAEKNVPFSVKRIYVIKDCTRGLDRGHHAHRKTIQALFCLAGTADIYLTDGVQQETVRLHHSAEGIILKPKIWHEMKNMTKKTILLAVASDYFDEKDYMRNYDDFLQECGRKRHDHDE